MGDVEMTPVDRGVTVEPNYTVVSDSLNGERCCIQIQTTLTCQTQNPSEAIVPRHDFHFLLTAVLDDVFRGFH